MNTKVNDIVQKSTIQFPCENYSIRVIGNKTENFIQEVYKIVHKYDSNCDMKNFKTKESAKGNYLSLKFAIKAESIEQLQQLNQELRNLKFIQTVL